MEFEVGGTFSVDDSFNEDDICCESGDVSIKVHDPDKRLLI